MPAKRLAFSIVANQLPRFISGRDHRGLIMADPSAKQELFLDSNALIVELTLCPSQAKRHMLEKTGMNKGHWEPKIINWPSSEGSPMPLGVTYLPEEGAYNFALYSKNATEVTLLLFNEENHQTPVVEVWLEPLSHKTKRVWHCRLKENDLHGARHYAYRVDGPVNSGASSMYETGAIASPAGRLRSRSRAESLPNSGSFSATSISRHVSTTHATTALLRGVRPSPLRSGVLFYRGIARQIQASPLRPAVPFSVELSPNTRDRKFFPTPTAAPSSIPIPYGDWLEWKPDRARSQRWSIYPLTERIM